MSFCSSAQCLWFAVALCACASKPWPDPPPIDRATFLTEHANWRLSREQGLRENWVPLAGLWLLGGKPTAFGTDSSLPIVLPGHGSRRVLGTFVPHGRTVQLEPVGPGLLWSNNNGPFRPIDSTVVLLTDDDSVPSYVRFGSFRLWIHFVDGRVEHAVVLELFTPEGIGTMITPDLDRITP